MARAAILVALVGVALAGPVRADALQDRLVAGARAAVEQPYTRTSRIEQRGARETEVATRVERYDPARPEGKRWTLVSSDGKPPTEKQVAEHAKATAKGPAPGYWRLARWLGARATVSAYGRVYRYPSLPEGAFVINGRDISADCTAEVTVNRDGAAPWVERVRLLSTKPFRMMLVAKVDRVEAVQSFRLDGGRPALAESVTELHGSMMGKSGSMRTVATFAYPVR